MRSRVLQSKRRNVSAQLARAAHIDKLWTEPSAALPSVRLSRRVLAHSADLPGKCRSSCATSGTQKMMSDKDRTEVARTVCSMYTTSREDSERELRPAYGTAVHVYCTDYLLQLCTPSLRTIFQQSIVYRHSILNLNNETKSRSRARRLELLNVKSESQR